MLPGQQIGERTVDLCLALLGEHDPHPAAVMWIALASHQPSRLESVNPVCHRAARHHRLAAELAWGEGIRIPSTPKCRENVELPGLNSDRVEGTAPGEIQVAGKTGDAAEHLEGADIEVRALTPPGRYEVVDFITHHVMVRQES